MIDLDINHGLLVNHVSDQPSSADTLQNNLLFHILSTDSLIPNCQNSLRSVYVLATGFKKCPQNSTKLRFLIKMVGR